MKSSTSLGQVIARLAAAACALAWCGHAAAQVVINEVVVQQRTTGGLDVADTREFIELYNAGAGSVDVGGWTLNDYRLNSGATTFSDFIPVGTTLAPGDYYVMGATGVPNVDQVLDGGGPLDLYPDNAGVVLELRNASSSLVDALAYETYRAPQLTFAGPEQIAQIGGGWYGEPHSANTSGPLSLGRWRDGRDGDNNGRDFGLLPTTPGTTNNLPSVGAYFLPNVDAQAIGSDVASMRASYVLPRVVDPLVVDENNPKSIPPSPQGGRAIVTSDPTGGGNVAFSRVLVQSFDIFAYLETAPLGIASSLNGQHWESTIFGIGTTDDLFRNPDPTGLIATDSPTRNGSTGMGWLFQRFEAAGGASGFTKLSLVEFGDGGNSEPNADWTIILTLNLAATPSGWHRLGIAYDPATGLATGRFGNQTFQFTTETDLLGTFYTGYREALGGVPGAFSDRSRPPTIDRVPEPAAGVLALIGAGAWGGWRRAPRARRGETV